MTLNLIDQHYGRLTVVAPVPFKPRRRWLCRCDCGNERVLPTDALRTGNTKSCGCLHREQTANLRKTHGLSRTRPYTIWAGMFDRCTRSKNRAWRYYGGKGIAVCDDWQDFAVFHAWALANGYRDDLSIDRLDSGKGYEPSNCEWVSRGENVARRNRRPQ